MNVRTLSSHALRCGIAAAVLAAIPACAAGGEARLSVFHPQAHSAKPITINKNKLLHPSHKYYGIFTAGAPANMSSVTGQPPATTNSVTTETGKQPNLDLYFQAWNAGSEKGKTDFSLRTAENACAAGLLPMYTWESWDTSQRGTNSHRGTNIPGVLWAQKAFAPHKIIAGDFDPYIRATADLMKTLQCPIAVRFDQEPNGYWYPWGETTDGMPGATPAIRAARYVKMWRHVVTIFRNQGATNVIWVWSPNFQSLAHAGYPDLSASYPGNGYVDWVGIDGYYYNNPQQTFKGLFGPTIQQLKPFAHTKPWLIAETGVGTYPDSTTKPSQIRNLLNAVAGRKRFNGVTYFDEDKANDRSDWKFDSDQDSLAAFKAGIANPVYAHGKAGSFSASGAR
jgi:hypothetical protein